MFNFKKITVSLVLIISLFNVLLPPVVSAQSKFGNTELKLNKKMYKSQL